MAQDPCILLASDLSARSDRPLDRACLLARQLSGSVVMLHVIAGGSDGDGREENLRKLIDRDLGELASQVEVLLLRGDVPETIVATAQDRDCALIVTGVARFNSPSDFIVGTAVDHLVRHAPVPVLVVKRRPNSDYARLLVATDFSPCSRSALEAAAAQFPKARVTLVHICHPAYEAWLDPEATGRSICDEARDEMKAFADSLDQGLRERVDTLVEEGELLVGIDRLLRDQDFDLLVVGTHGRGGFAHATIGSRAAELLVGAVSDVLMVRAPRPVQ